MLVWSLLWWRGKQNGLCPGLVLYTVGGYGSSYVTLRCGEGSDMSTVTVTVTGMTCGHCASSVREEVGNIPEVRAVDVDLASGEIIIESDGPIELTAIKDAVVEAGYQLAG